MEFLKDGANPGCYIILVGTKLDLEEDGNKPRGVTRQQAQEYADKIGALHYETRSYFLSFPFPFFFSQKQTKQFKKKIVPRPGSTSTRCLIALARTHSAARARRRTRRRLRGLGELSVGADAQRRHRVTRLSRLRGQGVSLLTGTTSLTLLVVFFSSLGGLSVSICFVFCLLKKKKEREEVGFLGKKLCSSSPSICCLHLIACCQNGKGRLHSCLLRDRHKVPGYFRNF